MPDIDPRLAAARAAGLPEAHAHRLIGDDLDALTLDAQALVATLGELSAPPAPSPPPAPSADGFDAGARRDQGMSDGSIDELRRLVNESPVAFNDLMDRLSARGGRL